MADNNNSHLMNLPTKPNSKITELAERLVGKWRVKGPEINGTVEFELMEGGFFLIQHIDFMQGGKIKGIEYIGYDPDTDTLRSHFMDINGSNFTYTWTLNGKKLRINFGDKDSDMYFEATFNDDNTEYSGAWHYPDGGGYTATLTRIE
ncbi:MAG TPA: lipocalin family protein [Candidatus Saccharimonadales bacterium]|nr:lipocalin family protein [Candidatus Saccharimonadales bacterium]